MRQTKICPFKFYPVAKFKFNITFENIFLCYLQCKQNFLTEKTTTILQALNITIGHGNVKKNIAFCVKKVNSVTET